jgi:hypothetical protein
LKLEKTDMGLVSNAGTRRPAPRSEKKQMEEPKMRLNATRMILSLAGGMLLATGAASSSPPSTATATPAATELSPYRSEQASTLLTEIQKEAVGLRRSAETLGTFARNPQFSWQTHAGHLERVKRHINAVGERIAELQRIRNSVLPWQEQAITEVTDHAAQVAASTQAAIGKLNDNRNSLLLSEYRDHLRTIDDRSADMKERVDKFLDYERTQQKFLQLQDELELSGD